MVGRRTTGRLGQGSQRTLIALLAPLAHQRRVQALASEEGALAGLVQAFVLAEEPRLVGRAVPALSRPLRDLRIRPRLRARGHIGISRHRVSGYHEPSPYRPLDSKFPQGQVSQVRLTQRVVAFNGRVKATPVLPRRRLTTGSAVTRSTPTAASPSATWDAYGTSASASGTATARCTCWSPGRTSASSPPMAT